MRHVLSALVQNVPGVPSHISGMLAWRGYNIDSLAVGETDSPHLSRMTFVALSAMTTCWTRFGTSWKRSSRWSASMTSARAITWNAI